MGTMLTWDEMMTKTTVNKLHPEVRRRFKAMIEKAASVNVPLGVGTGWRIQPVGQPGFAAPGNSYHEGFPADGVAPGALAIDTVPDISWTWLQQNCGAYGFLTFWNVNNEPWHAQPVEIPKSRNYATTCPPVPIFNLPGTPTPTPPARKKLMYALLKDELGAHWATNMLEARYLYNQKAMDIFKSMLTVFGYGTTPTNVQSADVKGGMYGVIVGTPPSAYGGPTQDNWTQVWGVDLPGASGEGQIRSDLALQEIRAGVKKLQSGAPVPPPTGELTLNFTGTAKTSSVRKEQSEASGES